MFDCCRLPGPAPAAFMDSGCVQSLPWEWGRDGSRIPQPQQFGQPRLVSPSGTSLSASQQGMRAAEFKGRRSEPCCHLQRLYFWETSIHPTHVMPPLPPGTPPSPCGTGFGVKSPRKGTVTAGCSGCIPASPPQSGQTPLALSLCLASPGPLRCRRPIRNTSSFLKSTPIELPSLSPSPLPWLHLETGQHCQHSLPGPNGTGQRGSSASSPL